MTTTAKTTSANASIESLGITLDTARALRTQRLTEKQARIALAEYAQDMTYIAQESVTIGIADYQVYYFVATEIAALRLCFAFSATKGIRYAYSENMGTWFVTNW